ncbi:MOSC domain-containing protein [Zavarzinia compransoris]|uniref:MOSC domain-containing protein n=1 Tax=Zavarzinia marina TaxID=2911065 RepID=UPI001F26AE66|nr:MOSC domain-containing protein [Zavarzinia marina]MCF4165296.1 MOSC domain-containing protein [Zavarzinia marina]
MTGTLIGIARRSAKRAPMEEMTEARVSPDAGVEGDFRGKPGKRQVTVLAAEGFAAAVAEIVPAPARAPWTLRRANLLVEGVSLPRTPGARLSIGDLILEVTGETDPCSRMDEQVPGLTKALTPDWRGGVTCRVIAPGTIRLGDAVDA